MTSTCILDPGCFLVGGRHVFGEISKRLIKIGSHPNLPFHPSHPALRLSGFDRMELYDGLVSLRDDDLFSVERLLDNRERCVLASWMVTCFTRNS